MIIDFMDELTWTASPAAGVQSSVQTVVGNAATAIVGGRIKDGLKARDWGGGEAVVPWMRVVAAVTEATDGLTVDIVGADNAALTSNPVVLSTKTVALAALTAGSLHALPPLTAGTLKRYLGTKLTPLGANSAAGSVIVGLLPAGARVADGVVTL